MTNTDNVAKASRKIECPGMTGADNTDGPITLFNSAKLQFTSLHTLNIYANEPFLHPKELKTFIFTQKEPCLQSKEPCIHSKKPTDGPINLFNRTELQFSSLYTPYIHSKENCHHPTEL